VRQLLMLAFMSALTLFAATSSSPALAQDSCGETFDECAEKISQAADESVGQDLVESSIIRAAEDADPVNEAEMAEITDETKPKPGSSADLIKAILATDVVKRVINDLKTPVLEKAQADWARLQAGEKIGLLTFAITIATPTVINVLSDPKTHKPAQDLINGAANAGLKAILPWVSMKIDILSPNKTFTLNIDVLQIMRKAGVKF
jgi:hypothetical protein